MVVPHDYYIQNFTKSVLERYIYNQEPPSSAYSTRPSKVAYSTSSHHKVQNEERKKTIADVNRSNSGNIQRVFPQMLSRRQMGLYSPSFVESYYLYHGLRKLELSSKYEVEAKQKGAIRALSLDQQENRYLLSGASNASVALYDLWTYPRYTKDHKKRSRDHEYSSLSNDRDNQNGGNRRRNDNQYNILYGYYYSFIAL